MDSYKIQNWKQEDEKYKKATFSTCLERINDRKRVTSDYLSISKFPELNLMQLVSSTYEEGRGIPYGLVAVVNSLDSFIGNLDNETRAVKADARLSVNSSKYRIPEIHGYFSKGGLIAVCSSFREVLEPYVKDINEYSGRADSEKALLTLFEEAINKRFGKDSFVKIKEAVKNSNLSEDYKEAVKGIL